MSENVGRSGNARKRRLRVTPRFFGVIAALFLLSMAVSYVSGFVEIWKIRREIRQVEEEIAQVEQRNAQLREELEYLQSDEYIEKVAREELGLVKPGETAIFVAPVQEPPESRTGSPTPGP